VAVYSASAVEAKPEWVFVEMLKVVGVDLVVIVVGNLMQLLKLASEPVL